MTENLNFSLFSIYDIEVLYPGDWEVRVKQGSKYTNGSVMFCTQDLHHAVAITIGWGDLNEARKRFTTAEEQAKDTIKRLEKERKYSRAGFELIKQEKLVINSHEAIKNISKMTTIDYSMVLPWYTRKVDHDVQSIFFHCQESSRYFVIICDGPPNNALNQELIFEYMLTTLKCHCKRKIINLK
ncbi:MAG: hypothetical protein QXT31_04600 [Candidatus Bathyarchaeia archaeon]